MGDARLVRLGWQDGTLRLGLRTGGRAEIVLCDEETGERVRFPAEPGAEGHVGVIDVSEVSHGVWRVTVDGDPLRYEPDLDPRPQRHYIGSTAVSSYYSVGDGALTLDVGGDLRAVGPDALADRVSWRGPDPTVVVTGHLALPDLDIPATVTLALRHEDAVYDAIASTTPEPDRLTFTTTIPLLNIARGRPLPRGDWEVSVKLAVSGLHRELRLQTVSEPFHHPWWRRGMPMTIRTTPPPGPLSLIVRHMDAGGLRQRLHHRTED